MGISRLGTDEVVTALRYQRSVPHVRRVADAHEADRLPDTNSGTAAMRFAIPY